MDNQSIRPDSNNDSWHVLLHLSSLAMFVFPFGNILGPLIVWTMKKREMPGIDSEGRVVLNFHITWTLIPFALILIVVIVSLILGGGFFALLDQANLDQLSKGSMATIFMIAIAPIVCLMVLGLAVLFEVIMSIVNAMRSGNGQSPNYPMRIQFIDETRGD